MKKEELINRLRELKEKHGNDVESIHMAADVALLAFINDKDISEAFESLPRWYS